MTRTATIGNSEANMATVTPEFAKTFKPMSTEPQKEYHFLTRTVNRIANEMGAITGDMLDADIMDWLNAGYTLFAVHHLGDVKGHGGENYGNLFAYHFVKG